MFNDCKSQEETKRLYKRLALRLHPDNGGDNELMKILNEHYDFHLEYLKSRDSEPFSQFGSTKKSYSSPPVVHKHENKLKNLLKDLEKRLPTAKSRQFIASVLQFLCANEYITLKQYETLVRIKERSPLKEEYANT